MRDNQNVSASPSPAAHTSGATPRPSLSSVHHAVHAVEGLNLDQWLAIAGVLIGVVGAIFGFLQWRQAVQARKDAKISDKARHELVKEIAGLKDQLREQHEAARAAQLEQQRSADLLRHQEQRAPWYQQVDQLAQYRIEYRQHERQTGRFRLDGRHQEPPRRPLTDDEVKALNFQTERVASPAVKATLATALERHEAWNDTLWKRASVVQQNAMHDQARNPHLIVPLIDSNRLIEAAAENADEADHALIQAMGAEVTLTQDGSVAR